jgi:hypothetical protein
MIMKHLKFYVMALLSLMTTSGMLHAQGSAAMSPGKVQAFIVQGDVQLIAKDGTAAPLKRGQTFEEGNIVKAGPGSQALLVFSNGATMKVLENCQLSVDEFKQAKFDETAEGTFLRLSKDPSKSTTTLDLRNGTLQGEVKQLNQAAGSKFTVNTPAGSAGIRGTIVSMSVVRNAQGQVVGITCNCIIGNVAFTPSAAVASGTTGGAGTQTVTNTNVDVGSGATMAVTLTVDPATGIITGGAITGAGLPTATAQVLANALTETVNQAKADNNIAPQPAPTITISQPPTTGGGAPVTPPSVPIDPTPPTNGGGQLNPPSGTPLNQGNNNNNNNNKNSTPTNPTTISA